MCIRQFLLHYAAITDTMKISVTYNKGYFSLCHRWVPALSFHLRTQDEGALPFWDRGQRVRKLTNALKASVYISLAKTSHTVKTDNELGEIVSSSGSHGKFTCSR